MTRPEWDQITHFTSTENWGDPDKISFVLVQELEKYRSWIKRPIVITCGTQGKHVVDSQHYWGKAVDIVFPGADKDELFKLFLDALRFNFKGVGIYPHWEFEGKRCGGLHLDVRDEPQKAIWMQRLDYFGKPTYLPVNWSNMKIIMK